jgi:hypothetical protein
MLDEFVDESDEAVFADKCVSFWGERGLPAVEVPLIN